MSVTPDPQLERRARALYTRYGYNHTRARLGLDAKTMRHLLIDAGATPCPATHVLATWVAGEADRPLQSVHQAAKRDGVLKRTGLKTAGRASFVSVPKAWADAYVQQARRQDHVEDLWRAGWLTSGDVAHRFERTPKTVAKAAHGHGPLAMYLEPVERFTARQWHAWNPHQIRKALDAYRAVRHEARATLTPTETLHNGEPYARQRVNRAMKQLGIIRCHAPHGRRTAAFVRPCDAARIRETLRE